MHTHRGFFLGLKVNVSKGHRVQCGHGVGMGTVLGIVMGLRMNIHIGVDRSNIFQLISRNPFANVG